MVISGDVITRLPQLGQPLPVKSVSVLVRCYEVRSNGPFGADSEHVLWEKAKKVWEPPTGVEYVGLGDWEHPFRISIPPEAVDIAASAQCLREWKVIWRLEVAVDHQPIPYVGWKISKAYGLNLHNHRLPLLPPLSPPQAIHVGTDCTTTQIFLNSPHGAYGPGDTFNVSFHAKPDDPTTAIKKAIVVLERRIELLDHKASPKPSLRDVSPESAASSRLSSVFRRSASPRPHFHRILSDPTSPITDSGSSGRVIKDKVAEVICEQPTPGSGGAYWCRAAIDLPKRGGKWDLGETVVTKLVSVTYELKVKISVKATKPRVVCKEYWCDGVPVTLTAVSAAGRIEATTAISALESPANFSTTRRKHRSSRRGLYMHEGTIDISDPIIASHRRRAKTRSATSSPIISSVAGIVTDIKPILLPPDHPAQPQSISFMFPSPRPNNSPSKTGESRSAALPPIETLIHPSYPIPPVSRLHPTHTITSIASPTSPPSTAITPPRFASVVLTPPSSKHLSPPNTCPSDYESFSILRQFQHSGRRISTTMSEEEEMQPSRSRQKLREEEFDRRAGFGFRPALPSLDALGLGLPQVPDDGRPISRPRTAPMYATFAMRAVPPPLTCQVSAGSHGPRSISELARRASECIPIGGSFAFTVHTDAEEK